MVGRGMIGGEGRRSSEEAINLFDNVFLRLGDDTDCVITLSSAGLSANEELADVIVGTSVYANAIPANSLILSNVTDDGDIVFFMPLSRRRNRRPRLSRRPIRQPPSSR